MTTVDDPSAALAMHSNFEPGSSGGLAGQLTVTVTPVWALMPLAICACTPAWLKVALSVVTAPRTGDEITITSSHAATDPASRPSRYSCGPAA